MSDSDKIKSLLARGLERTLEEQVQHAYTTLLTHVESLFAKVNEMAEDDPANDDLQDIRERLSFMVAKNIRMKTKLYHHGEK